MIWIIGLVGLLFGVLFTIYYVRFKKLSKEYLSEQRVGYYDYKGLYFKSDPNDTFRIRVFISELESYTNGESKIKFLRHEIHYTPSNSLSPSDLNDVLEKMNRPTG